MKKARDEIVKITAIRLEYRDTLVAHDIVKFRSFIRDHSDMVGADAEKVLAYADDKLSEYMHAVKCAMFFMGAEVQHAFQNSSQLLQREAAHARPYPRPTMTASASTLASLAGYRFATTASTSGSRPRESSWGACILMQATAEERPNQRPAITIGYRVHRMGPA